MLYARLKKAFAPLLYWGIFALYTMGLLDTRSNVLMVSLLAILSAFVVELAFGLVSNSLALITDSMHALLDAIISVVLIVAARMAMKPADAGHTYGYGKLEPLGGMLGGIAIFMLACFFMYESIHRLQGPPPDVVPSLIGVVGGLYTVGIDVFRVYILRRALEGLGGHTLKADLHHAFMDMGSTVVAIVGIVVASVGLYFVDLGAALVLGVLLAFVSVKLVYRTALELTDVTSTHLTRDVRHIAKSVPGVIRVGPILLRRSGDTVFADATLVIRGDASFEKTYRITKDAQQAIKRHILQPPKSHDKDHIEHSHGLLDHIKDASITVHTEPDWGDVSVESKIRELVRGIENDTIKGISHVSTYESDGKLYADLHVKVDAMTILSSTYDLTDNIRSTIKDNLPGLEHMMMRLEPFDDVRYDLSEDHAEIDKTIRNMLKEYPIILGITKIVPLKFGNLYKIDIDCVMDGTLTVKEVYDSIVDMENTIRQSIPDAIITIHPAPA